METYRLRYFCTIAETGSLTKASKLLGVSHSGLSKSINALQDEVKLQLFRPLGRGLEITEEGKWFYQKVLEILKIENEIINGVKTEYKSIRIGLSEVIAICCAGLFANSLNCPLTLLSSDFGEIEGKILNNEIDFGIAFLPSPKIELEYLELGEVCFNSFVHKDLFTRVSVQEIPFVVPSTDFPFNPLGYKIRDGWPKDIPRRPYFAVNGFSVALDLLRAAEAAVYMPNFVASLENEKSGQRNFIKIPEHLEAESKRKIYLIKSKLTDETKEMKKSSKLIRKLCNLDK